MKLSKQERIGIFIIAIIIILAVGIFMFIVPKFEAIGDSNKSLANKTAELAAAETKAATKDGLKDQIITAYKDGENIADMFFSDMKAYEADMQFKHLIDNIESNVYITEYSIGEPGTGSLPTMFYQEATVEYPLKIYASQGVDQTEEEAAAAARRTILQNTLGSEQTVGAITVNFTVAAIDNEELLKFADEINNYVLKENSGNVRKAVILNGFSIEYPDITKKYDKAGDEIEEAAEKDALAALKKNFPDADWGDGTQQVAQEEEKKKETIAVSDTIYELTTSLTFYSVARMQDPTDQLKAQDGQA